MKLTTNSAGEKVIATNGQEKSHLKKLVGGLLPNQNRITKTYKVDDFLNKLRRGTERDLSEVYMRATDPERKGNTDYPEATNFVLKLFQVVADEKSITTTPQGSQSRQSQKQKSATGQGGDSLAIKNRDLSGPSYDQLRRETKHPSEEGVKTNIEAEEEVQTSQILISQMENRKMLKMTRIKAISFK